MRVAVALLLAILTACRPLYLPAVPEAPPLPSHTLLHASSSLEVVSGRPVLTLLLSSLADGDDGAWLAVQWFSPRNVQVASESLWVDANDVGRSLRFALPADVAVAPGEWRAVVSQGGAFLRQFRVDLVADPDSVP